MRIVWAKLVLGFVGVVFACASPGYASTFIIMSETDLATQSVAAVTGRVTDIEAAADPTSGGVNTYVHIAPDQVVFGSLPDGPVVLRETGGRVRGQSEWIFGSPEYRVDEHVLVFLSQNADGTLRTTAMSMGKFTLEQDAHGVLTAVRDLGEGAALWDLKRGQLVTDPQPEDYDFKGLLDAVRNAKPAAALRSLARRPAVEMVPPELERATVREHQESFTYLSTPSRWFEPDDGQPVSFVIDATGDVGVGAATSRAAIDDAFAAWTNVPTSGLIVSDGGTFSPPITFAGCDGGNRIVFNDPFNEVTNPSGCSGVLAVGGFCASSETRVVNGTTFRRIRVGKITFNNGWSACPGWNRCNISEVATHELGHTLGFGHTPDINATMYAAAHFDGRCASLRADDLAAVNFVYPNVTSLPTATPLPPTSTATPANTATRTPVATATSTRTASPTAPPIATATATRPPTVTATATITVPPTSTATPQARHQVRGHVMYNSTDRGVPNVTVNLSGAIQDATQTTGTGDYEFDSVTDGTWELAAQKASETSLAISPLDAAYVLQAVVELRTFDANQRLACDTTGDGQLSALDATRILQYSVGKLARLPVAETCGSDWTFTPEPAPMQSQSIVDPLVAGGTCRDGKIMLEDLLQDAPDQNFHAVLFGDCTGNWNPAQQAALERPGKGSARVRLGRPITRKTRVRVPVYVRATGSYQAVDLQLAYDATRLTPTGVVLRRASDSGIATFYVAQPGQLRVAMASGKPITHRGIVLRIEFDLAQGASGTGSVQALAASVDEAVARVRP